jgi:hypothetical protein
MRFYVGRDEVSRRGHHYNSGEVKEKCGIPLLPGGRKPAAFL